MKKLKYSKREVWFGINKVMGPFLYDKGSQKGLEQPNAVRLYILNDKKSSMFEKDTIKKNLIDIDSLLEKKHEPQINNYINVLKKRDEAKYTHCFNCKEDINSIDFTICDSCKGIRCTCSACFCEWKDYIDY